MNNKQVALVLYEIAQLLELQAENAFKIRAYENAAHAIESLDRDVAEVSASGKLQQIPGIGKAIAEKIQELLTTGKMAYHENLKSHFPASLHELLRVPNLGPRKIKMLYDTLGIASLKELERACLENRLVGLKGFGKVTQQKILQSVQAVASAGTQHLLSKVLPIARQIREYMEASRSVERVEIAGSVRRWKEIINDLDFVASSSSPSEVAEHFLKLPFASTIVAHGDTKVTVRLDTLRLGVDLRIVKPNEFATAMHHFTGSKEHNVAMRGHAKRLGYKINEYGIFKEGRTRPETLSTEEELYEFFEMQYIPPELRENMGEVETALHQQIPPLVTGQDVKGVFHVHSTWSDGHDTLENMIQAAVDRGYEYVGISEHSKVASYAHGLDERRLAEQSAEIDRLQKKFRQIKILKGSEVDILADGSLDFPDEVLKKLDFVIGSVHSFFKMEEKQMTERICRALANPELDILGHSTGRLLLSRKGYAVDLDEVLRTAAKHNKVIEINANPRRLDIDWRYIVKGRNMGIRFSINPDAHYIHEMDHMEYGVAMARKGWATPTDIINTRPWKEVRRLLER